MKKKRRDTKGQNGKVLVIGGSKDYIGAPALAAMSALRTGVDLVTICAPEKVAWTINSYSPDFITKKFLGDELNVTHCKEIVSISNNFDVVLIGTGLGLKKDFILKLLREIKKPFVLDADAIKVLSMDVISNSIITPHKKEFEILFNTTIKKYEFDELDMEVNIKRMQKFMGDNVILLKGVQDIVFTQHRRNINRSGHDSMTIGGTGDILAGICAGYLALSGNLFEAAKHSAFVSGKLGEYMFKQRGYGYTAYEMVEELWRFTK